MKIKGKSAALCIVLAAVLTVGCTGGKGKRGTLEFDKSQFSETGGLKLPITEKNEKIQIMTSSSVSDLENKMFTQALEELTGIKVSFQTVASGTYVQKLQMLMASKQLPDIFDSTLTRAELESMAKNKVLVNFAEYKDELPNINEIYLSNSENMRLAANYVVDGGLYVVPGYNIARDINHGFMYRKDIFDKNGINPWTNTDEFYQALKRLKEIYPDSTPFAAKQQVKLISSFATGWGFSGTGISQYKQQGDYIYAGTHSEMKNLRDFMNRLYNEGLLDPEFLTCTEASWASKMTQDGKAFATFDWIDRMDLFYEQIKGSNPDYNLSFAYPIGPCAAYVRLPKVGAAAMAVNNNSKKDISMKVVDFLLSPAGAKLATLGIEGMSYDMEGDKVKYKLPEDSLVNVNTLEENYGLFTQCVALRFDPKCVYYQYTPHVQAAQDMVNEKNLLKEKPDAHLVIESDAEEYSKLTNDLDTAFSTYASKYIVASPSETEKIWNEWNSEAKRLGVDKLVNIANNNAKK